MNIMYFLIYVCQKTHIIVIQYTTPCMIMELNLNISNVADLLWCIIYQRYENCIQLSSVIIITIIIGYFFSVLRMRVIIKYTVALLRRSRVRRRGFNTRTAQWVFLGLNKKGGSVTNEKNIIRNGGVEKKGKRKQSSDLCSAENRMCGAGRGR